MSEDVEVVLIGSVYRFFCLLAGFGFGVLGYRLYVKGVLDKSEEIKGHWGDKEVILKNVAPGVLFGIAGIIISALGVVRPIQTGNDRQVVALVAHEAPKAIISKVSQGADLTEQEKKELQAWMNRVDAEFKNPSNHLVVMKYPSEKLEKHWWEFWKF
jgi:hypothetical protein